MLKPSGVLIYFLKLPRVEQVSKRTCLDIENLLGKYSALNRTKMSRKQKLTIAKDWNSVEQLSPAAFDISSSKFPPWRTEQYTSYSVRELLGLTNIASVPGDSSWIWKIKLDQWLAGKSHSNNALCILGLSLLWKPPKHHNQSYTEMFHNILQYFFRVILFCPCSFSHGANMQRFKRNNNKVRGEMIVVFVKVT